MKKKIINQVLFCVGGIVIILLITNPSNEQYTVFLKANGFEMESHFLNIEGDSFTPFWGKKRNFFLFSTFSYHEGKSPIGAPNLTIYHNGQPTTEDKMLIAKNHIGILLNFYQVK